MSDKTKLSERGIRQFKSWALFACCAQAVGVPTHTLPQFTSWTEGRKGKAISDAALAEKLYEYAEFSDGQGKPVGRMDTRLSRILACANKHFKAFQEEVSKL